MRSSCFSAFVAFGPCCACTANDQGHIQLPGRFQDHFKITPNHIARRCHLPRPQIKRARIDRSHVASNKVWFSFKASLKRLLNNTKPQLPRRRQNTKSFLSHPMAVQQARYCGGGCWMCHWFKASMTTKAHVAVRHTNRHHQDCQRTPCAASIT